MNVIITGASRGLGKALAHKFGSAGYDLWLTSVSETRLYKAMEELMTYYPDINIKAKAADLSVKEC
jgi:short-subunit dehydrogenase